MSSVTEKLVRHGFTSSQAAILEELYPEVIRQDSVDPAARYALVPMPVGLLSVGSAAVSCSQSAVDEPLATIVIKAGLLGPRSILQIEPLWTFTNSANNKILKVTVGGVSVYSATRTTSVREAPLIVLANRNSLTSQIKPYDSTYTTADATSPVEYSIDFSKLVTIDIFGQRASSGDTLKLEYYRVLHFMGD